MTLVLEFKDFTKTTRKSYGKPSLDDLQCYPKTNYCSKPVSKSHREKHLRSSFAGLEAARLEEEDVEEESSAALTELFHGFLAIGTLGTEPIIADPSTPTFSISVDHIAEKETEVTENELNLINSELEKVLGAEGRDECCNISSGRNSHVSARSSSQSSIIILNENGGIVCPLQSYLFGSAVGLSETAPPAKKEHRTSLGDLFQKTQLAEENPGGKSDRTEKRTDKSVVHIMKRMIKRRMLHASTTSSTEASGAQLDSASAETKMCKILQMFHRKIHPESSTATRKSHKPTQNETKSNITAMGASHIGGPTPTAEDIIICPQLTISKESIGTFKNQSYPPEFTLSSGDANGNKEHWVKTDADYLVLEL
ncbi:hypothetical protein Adt_29178 [Abeliophyllum distichum]|uniref:LAZY1 n=1 Tax=Abeliophyllum distichum TaxID=126358 RepID=A0ABD1R7M8_9LAMI